MSDCLWPHGLQHTRLPCLSPSPRVCSNSCPSSRWCHPTISSSVVPFSCAQSFPASGSFPMSWLFPSGSQSIGASASALVLPMNIQGWFPFGLNGLIFLQSKGLSRVFSSTTVQIAELISSRPRTALCLSTGWDFPGGPVVKTPCFPCRRHGFDPGSAIKIPHAMQCTQKKSTNYQHWYFVGSSQWQLNPSTAVFCTWSFWILRLSLQVRANDDVYYWGSIWPL